MSDGKASTNGGSALSIGFAERLGIVLKTISVSRGQLAADLGLDKSVVSRWLSGATVPTDHNLARLTARLAKDVAGFTMFDWERDVASLQRLLGVDADDDTARISPSPTIVGDLEEPLPDLPDFATLPAFAAAVHETAARASRYCGMWASWMPTVGQQTLFHCEHTVIRQEGNWLVGEALGVCYRWPLTGFVANGQLLLVFSDVSDFVIRQFNRADEPIIDAVDGLMMAAASLPHQAPTACRVIMERVTPVGASAVEIDEAAKLREADRRFWTADELPDGLAEFLLPDCGPAAENSGGDRLLRADSAKAMMKTRWF